MGKWQPFGIVLVMVAGMVTPSIIDLIRDAKPVPVITASTGDIVTATYTGPVQIPVADVSAVRQWDGGFSFTQPSPDGCNDTTTTCDRFGCAMMHTLMDCQRARYRLIDGGVFWVVP